MSWRERPGDAYADDADGYEAAREPSPRRSGLGPPRLTATRVTLGLAVIASIVYLAYAGTVRDTRQIPLLASGAVVLGLVFGALAVAGGIATYHSGRDGLLLRALLNAIAGGVAGIIAAGAFAFGLVLVLAYRA
jgi:uncharacterized membrane protein (DUF4010 family)